jgi:hypothetical protein
MTRVLMAAALAAGLLPTASARADDEHHHGREHAEWYFTDGDRTVVRTYYHDTYRDGCPPGFVRSGYDCFSPGQARLQYTIGQRLAPSIVVAPVPEPLAVRLGPAPAGYAYGVVDGDVVRYDAKSRLIVDAIRALVH